MGGSGICSWYFHLPGTKVGVLFSVSKLLDFGIQEEWTCWCPWEQNIVLHLRLCVLYCTHLTFPPLDIYFHLSHDYYLNVNGFQICFFQASTEIPRGTRAFGMQALSFLQCLALLGPTFFVLWLWFWSVSGACLLVIWWLLRRCISHACSLWYDSPLQFGYCWPWVAHPCLGPHGKPRAGKQGPDGCRSGALCSSREAFLFVKVQKSIQELLSTQTAGCSGQDTQKCWYLSWKCKRSYSPLPAFVQLWYGSPLSGRNKNTVLPFPFYLDGILQYRYHLSGDYRARSSSWYLFLG